MKKIIFFILLIIVTSYAYAYTPGPAKPPSDIDCFNLYEPVCAQSPLPECLLNHMCKMPQPGPTTYSNECVAKNYGSEILYKGRCKVSTDSIEKEISDNCIRWFDGCNTCSRANNGDMVMCTMMACKKYSEPHCIKFKEKENLNNLKEKRIENDDINNTISVTNHKFKNSKTDNNFHIINKIQEKKFLGIFNVELFTKLLIDNDSGKVIKERKPWYSFLLF